jgi:Ser/Thr protein kinase RdoA (MazF antagonist)
VIQPVPHLPRPARVAAAAAARWSRPGIPAPVVTEVVAAHGLAVTGRPRNLQLGRRSHNVVVPTSQGPVVVKQYRADWDRARVEHAHAVLDRLQQVGSPGPRLRHRGDGGTCTSVGPRTLAVLDLLPGRNLSLDYLRRRDRVRAAAVAGRTLARLHHALEGFEPTGAHHLGFASLAGPPRQPLHWYTQRLEELAGGTAATPTAGALADRARWLARRLERTEDLLTSAELPRLVVHGDFGLHNLLFTSADEAVPVDFELARVDWRLSDLVLALARFGPHRTDWDWPLVVVFLRAYAELFPFRGAELSRLSDVWAVVRLTAAVRAWDRHVRGGTDHQLRAAAAAVREVEWLEAHPHVLDQVAEVAQGAAFFRPTVGPVLATGEGSHG